MSYVDGRIFAGCSARQKTDVPLPAPALFAVRVELRREGLRESAYGDKGAMGGVSGRERKIASQSRQHQGFSVVAGLVAFKVSKEGGP